MTEIMELIDHVSNQIAKVHPEGPLYRRKASELVTGALSRASSWIVDYQRTGILQVPKIEGSAEDDVRTFAEQMVEVSVSKKNRQILISARNCKICKDSPQRNGEQLICR
jgi:hypothetical protein